MEEYVHSFEEAKRLLHDRINLEQLQHFMPQDMEGRLDTLRYILDSHGNPDGGYRTIHITGTKGKGSTCIMLESILLQAGFRVGRFSSPHLYSFTERLAVDGIPCPPDDFTELFFSLYETIATDIFQSLTYFELLTLLSFVYFSQKKVDIALFEVGLGGRFDATNICRPAVSVITSIGYEHMQQLGFTLSEIAFEKSGIIKPHVPVITTVQDFEPLRVIKKKAESVNAPLFIMQEDFYVQQMSTAPYIFQYRTSPSFPVEWTQDHLSLNMPGSHQIENASAALSAFLLLQKRNESISDNALLAESIHLGIHQASLPLRVEIYRESEDFPTFIFDGAHNRSSMHALVRTVSEMFPRRRCLLIFGTTLGKDVSGMFAELAGRFDSIFLTQYSESNRRFPPQELCTMLVDCPNDNIFSKNIIVTEHCTDALAQCQRAAKREDVICITGSLYLAGELRSMVYAHNH